MIGTALASFLVLEAGVLVTWAVGGIVGDDWSVGYATTVAVAIQSVASAAIFVPFGIILGRATLAGLGYLLVWEGVLSNIIEGIQASSVSRIVVSGWADLAPMTIYHPVLGGRTARPGRNRTRRGRRQGGGDGAGVGGPHGLVLRHKDLVGN